MRHPATLLPAGEGRRGDLLPAPSPVDFNHTGEDSVSANLSAKRNIQHSRERSEAAARLQGAARLPRNAAAPSLSARHAEKEAFQGASPIGVGLSRAGLCPRGISPAHTPVKPITGAAGSGSRNSQSALTPPGDGQLPGAADGCEAPDSFRLHQRAFPCARANSSASGPRLSHRSPAGASGRNSHQPVSCGGTGCAFPSAAAWKSQTRNSFCEHLGQRMAVDRASQSSIVPSSRSSDRPALTSSAMTADPRRADPGNPLAGAAFSPRCLPNWPVALRGGGHIAGVV